MIGGHGSKGEKVADAAFDRLARLTAEHFGVDPATLSPDTSLVVDLDADSLDMTEIVMLIENEYHLQIADEDAEKIVTLADALAYLRKVRAIPD